MSSFDFWITAPLIISGVISRLRVCFCISPLPPSESRRSVSFRPLDDSSVLQLGLLLDTTLGFLFGVLVDTLSDDGKGVLFGYNIELHICSIMEYLKMIKYNGIGCF